jgi:DNA-directed RNA polymerase specialized sigma24 family protein
MRTDSRPQKADEIPKIDLPAQNGDCVPVALIESVVKPVVRRKLHVTLDPADTSARNQDALELVGEVQVLLLAGLARERGEGVRDVASYAAATAANVCYQYFRTKFPVRTREANRLRYILSHKKDFAIWKSAAERWVCGSAAWEHSGRAAESVPEIVDVERIIRGKDERHRYSAVLEWVFERSGGPVHFDELVDAVMAAFDLRERSEREGDETALRLENVPDARPLADDALVSAESLRELWCAVLRLPVRHRQVLLLNLKDRGGAGVIALLPLTGTASVREIAAALDFAAEDFAAVWNELPWDDRRIADHLGVARQQVINLRQTARAKLFRHLRENKNMGR